MDLYKKIKSLGYRIHMVCIDATPRNGYQKIGSEESFFPGGASKKTLGLLDRFVT